MNKRKDFIILNSLILIAEIELARKHPIPGALPAGEVTLEEHHYRTWLQIAKYFRYFFTPPDFKVPHAIIFNHLAILGSGMIIQALRICGGDWPKIRYMDAAN